MWHCLLNNRPAAKKKKKKKSVSNRDVDIVIIAIRQNHLCTHSLKQIYVQHNQMVGKSVNILIRHPLGVVLINHELKLMYIPIKFDLI